MVFFVLFRSLKLFFFLFVWGNIFAHKPVKELTNSGILAGTRSLTIDNGLSQNLASCILQDQYGFIWIGTKDGLNMYDGYSFRTFQHVPFELHSLSDNFVTAIHEDKAGRIWVGTFSGGLNLLDRESGHFIVFKHEGDPENSLSHNHIKTILDDESGNLWVGTYGGGLNKIQLSSFEGDLLKGDVPEIRQFMAPEEFPEMDARINALTLDSHNRLWIGTYNGIYTVNLDDSEEVFKVINIESLKENGQELGADADRFGGRVIFEAPNGVIWMGNALGLFNYDIENEVFERYSLANGDHIAGQILSAVQYTRFGNDEIWMTGPRGLTILNIYTGEANRLTTSQVVGNDMPDGVLQCLFIDSGGSVWFGSNGIGVYVYDPYTIKFQYPDDRFIASNGISESIRGVSIRAICETRRDKNYLWIGSNNGFYRTDRVNGTYQPVRFPENEALESTIIFSIVEADEGILWLGTGEGLVKYNTERDSYHLFETNLGDAHNQQEPRVCKVWYSDDGIWIVTPNTLARLDEASGGFEHFTYNHAPFDRLGEAVFPFIYEDLNGDFWIGANNGLHYFNRESGVFKTWSHQSDDFTSIPVNDIRAIVPDYYNPEKYLWLATAGGGLCRFDREANRFICYTINDGLPNNMVYGMLSDNTGRLWLSTNRGLSNFNPFDESFTNYSVVDGLQSNESNSGAFYKSPRGELFFGGIKGYNCFFADDIIRKTFQPSVVFTSFRVYASSEDYEILIGGSNTPDNAEFTLSHNHNNISVEFAALDFAVPRNKRYAYTLDAGEDQWIYLNQSRNVTFTNLKPGKYHLRVRGTNSDGIWSNRIASLFFEIKVPWWQMSWVYVILILLLSVLVLMIRRYELSRIKLKNSVRLAMVETNQLKELSQMKSRFFANISHELRTPLTLIKGPVEEMLEEAEDPELRMSLKMVHGNTKKLLFQINQLLDLSRLESGDYKVQVATGNIAELLSGLVMGLSSLARQKRITLTCDVNAAINNAELDNHFYYDQDIVEKIINNLLINALKFTSDKGVVNVRLKVLPHLGADGMVEISVEDSGKGIPADKIPYIFDRFYQADGVLNESSEGYGIGLSYVKELVKMHQGKIKVKSKVGKGTLFQFYFPLGRRLFTEEQILEMPFSPEKPLHDDIWQHQITGSEKGMDYNNCDKPRVLVVEDHAEVQVYISNCLKKHYFVTVAESAHKGISAGLNIIPDLIISDIMMPGMDGFEYCKIIKSNDKTSHIPVILLTARAAVNDRLQGLETGADDYLTKPFNPKELLIRVRNLIENRRLLREKFNHRKIVQPNEIDVTPRDRIFIENLMSVVEQNTGNEHFSVEDLAVEAGMSQSQIHRKLKAVVNQSANQFIRSVRMHRAKELLEKDGGNISEIAYLVGYSDPGYFSKTFRSFFGFLPSEINRQ